MSDLDKRLNIIKDSKSLNVTRDSGFSDTIDDFNIISVQNFDNISPNNEEITSS